MIRSGFTVLLGLEYRKKFYSRGKINLSRARTIVDAQGPESSLLDKREDRSPIFMISTENHYIAKSRPVKRGSQTRGVELQISGMAFESKPSRVQRQVELRKTLGIRDDLELDDLLAHDRKDKHSRQPATGREYQTR